MKNVEELANELITELKAQNNEKIETIFNIITPLVDRRYLAGWNEWGLRFCLDDEVDPLFVKFTSIITKRENSLKSDREDGLITKDINSINHYNGTMYETIRYLCRSGQYDRFLEYLISEAIPCFINGETPTIFFLKRK